MILSLAARRHTAPQYKGNHGVCYFSIVSKAVKETEWWARHLVTYFWGAEGAPILFSVLGFSMASCS